MRRSVREDLAATGRQEDREAEVDDRREVSKPGVQRNVSVLRAVRTHSPDVTSRQRHGLRPHGPQRAYRSGGSRRQERADGGEALERDVRQASAGSHPVAHSQRLRLTRHLTPDPLKNIFCVGIRDVKQGQNPEAKAEAES